MSLPAFQQSLCGNENALVWRAAPPIISKAEHGSSMRAQPVFCSPNRQTFTEAKLTSRMASGCTFPLPRATGSH